MKTIKNKKFYNFTEKQKRKDRNVNRDLPPAHFRKIFNDEFSAKCKQVLIKNLQGYEIEFPIFVKDIGWWYW
jgi:hypothetical protein